MEYSKEWCPRLLEKFHVMLASLVLTSAQKKSFQRFVESMNRIWVQLINLLQVGLLAFFHGLLPTLRM